MSSTTKTHMKKSLSTVSEDVPVSSGSTQEEDLTFSIALLPSELRQSIYKYYFLSLPPRAITSRNALSHHHLDTALALASSYFCREILPSTYYCHTTFLFSTASSLIQFSTALAPADRKWIRSVRIEVRSLSERSPDWVHLVLGNFESVREITFRVDLKGGDCKFECGKGEGTFESWWRCVRDAVREGAKGRKTMLRIDGGVWGVDEWVEAK